MATSVVLDTDIGTDVDDALALAVILGSPELELAGVTTVYGDVLLRARMVARVAGIVGHEVGPIVPGLAEPRSGRELFWAGHEGSLMPDLDQEQVNEQVDAIGLLAESATVVAVGPLTNVAAAVERPGHRIEQLFVMGCDFSLAEAEHNIKCDIDAAAAVFASGVPATVIGLDQTLRVRLDAAVVAEIEAAGELGRLLAAEMRQFWKFMAADSNAPHDPAAVLMLVEPELFTFRTGVIEIVSDGFSRFTASGVGPHRIVTDLDTEAVARRIVARILTACGK
ncbi:nucleoside hydrolase [Kribbella sancticallisti]|uniref:Nucleoside hydrolase n=1 Tax=Kribbella sancticallisti TaxID=460087 RepID=A0ABN2ELK7_9ACTN